MGADSEASGYDLVVLGCGAAGLSAAVSYAAVARARGRTPRIAVLERAPREGRGGATRWTSSWFRITEDRRLDPNFVTQMAEVSGGLADLDYCRALELEVPHTLGFLEANDVELIYFKQPFPNRNTGGGLGMPARGGVGIVDGLAGVVERTPGSEILYETEAVRLSLSEEGRVDGVVVRGRDGLLRRLAARAVVIACGGFEGSPEMLTQYVGARACDMPLIAPTVANNRGDGIRMAMAIGADTAGQFDMFHGEPIDARSSKPDAVVYAYPYGILVNGDGKRFFDEGKDSFDSPSRRWAMRSGATRARPPSSSATRPPSASSTWARSSSPTSRRSPLGPWANWRRPWAWMPPPWSAPSPSTTPPSGPANSTRTSAMAAARRACSRPSPTGPSPSRPRPSSPIP